MKYVKFLVVPLLYVALAFMIIGEMPPPDAGGGNVAAGDANGDGFVNGLDIAPIINFFLNDTPIPGNGDCNGDGSVNGLDIGCVINIFLGDDGGDGDGTKCTEITTEEFELLAAGFLGDLIEHAISLGYVEVEIVLFCTDEDRDEDQFVVSIINPMLDPPDDRVTLVFLGADDEFAFLVKEDSEGVITLFNQGGGLRILPNGQAEVIGPDGITPIDNSTFDNLTVFGQVQGFNLKCSVDLTSFLACLIGNTIQVGICGSALAAGCNPAALAGTGGLTCIAAAAICLEFFKTGPPSCAGPNGGNCEEDFVCSSREACSWGRCISVVPEPSGTTCLQVPICSDFISVGPINVIEAATCNQDGVCNRDRLKKCGPCESCTGGPGNARCEPPILGPFPGCPVVTPPPATPPPVICSPGEQLCPLSRACIPETAKICSDTQGETCIFCDPSPVCCPDPSANLGFLCASNASQCPGAPTPPPNEPPRETITCVGGKVCKACLDVGNGPGGTCRCSGPFVPPLPGIGTFACICQALCPGEDTPVFNPF